MVTEFNRENHAKNLPDSYAKHKESNNHKILEIERLACDKTRETLTEIEDILDLNNATGQTLDNYGDRVGQIRNGATDEKYVYMIKAKVMQNISNGSIPSIRRALCAIFDSDPSNVAMTKGENNCTVIVSKLPLSAITKAGFNLVQATEIVKSLLPVGVALETFMVRGSFVFGETDGYVGADAGFAEYDGGIGGQFGTLDERSE